MESLLLYLLLYKYIVKLPLRAFSNTSGQVFGPAPASGHATSGLPQHGFARISKWEYLGKSSSESSATPKSQGDASVKLDFGLSNTMLGDIPSEWKTNQFGITYSVTLNKDDLETSLAIRNTGDKEWDFKTLFHTYLAVDVSTQMECIVQ